MSAWLPISSAPERVIVNVVGRYRSATAGFPRYAMLFDGKWLEFSRHEPEELICWAWRPRDRWPHEGWVDESHMPEEDTTHE